jgi:hypothetical protein
MPRLICGMLLGLVATATQADDLAYLHAGMGAQAARRAVLQHGWVSDRTPHSRSVPAWGLQQRLLLQGFAEVESCAVDRPVCLLKYARHTACLEVVVEGESARHMRVTAWTQDCEVAAVPHAQFMDKNRPQRQKIQREQLHKQ